MRDPALVGLKSPKMAHAFPPSTSVLTLHNRLSAILSRDGSQHSSGDSQYSDLLSQLSVGNLSGGLLCSSLLSSFISLIFFVSEIQF